MSKAFLRGPDGRPLLYWCLQALEDAGIRRVVLAVDRPPAEQALDELLDTCPVDIETTVFHDEGAGVHGIPWQARDWLNDVFLFDAGHNVSAPGHYRALVETAQAEPGVAVFSAFRPRTDNPRFQLRLAGDGMSRALAQPMVVDRDYVRRLPAHGFDVAALATTYLARGALRAIPTADPVEFDVEGEYRHAGNRFEANAAECIAGTPWCAQPRPGAAGVTHELPVAG